MIERAGDASPHEAKIRQAIAAVDFETVAREYAEQGEFVFIPRFLSPGLVDEMVDEVRRFSPAETHRVRVPWTRTAGTIGQMAIHRKAPLLSALHRSPGLLEFTRRLSGQPLELKNDRDAHAAALYVYRRPGDHVAFHYDDCGCEGTASYTGTFGVINRTTSRVHVQLFRNDPARTMKEVWVDMEPGSFVFFCGARAYHRVTPLGRDEERVTFSFAHVVAGKRLRGFRRFTENIKDAILYFGPKAIFQKNYR